MFKLRKGDSFDVRLKDTEVGECYETCEANNVYYKATDDIWVFVGNTRNFSKTVLATFLTDDFGKGVKLRHIKNVSVICEGEA